MVCLKLNLITQNDKTVQNVFSAISDEKNIKDNVKLEK